MRQQERNPTARMPSARDHEPRTANDPRPHKSEAGYYRLSVTERSCRIAAPPAFTLRHAPIACLLHNLLQTFDYPTSYRRIRSDPSVLIIKRINYIFCYRSCKGILPLQPVLRRFGGLSCLPSPLSTLLLP